MARTRNSVKRAEENAASKKKKNGKDQGRAHALKLGRERAQRYREALKNNKRKYEIAKAKDRERKQKAKESGRIQPMAQKSQREQRAYRKRMREYMRLYRAKKKAEAQEAQGRSHTDSDVDMTTSQSNGPVIMPPNITEETPSTAGFNVHSTSDESLPPTSNVSDGSGAANSKNISWHKRQGRKTVLRNRSKTYRQNQALQKEHEDLKRMVMRLKKRASRSSRKIPSPKLTPRRKLRRISEGKIIAPAVKKQLFRGLALEEEVKTSAERIGDSMKSKVLLSKIISGRVLKKYKMHQTFVYLPLKSLRKSRKLVSSEEDGVFKAPLKFIRKTPEIADKKKKSIVDFYLSNRASHPSPNKKSFVRVEGEQVQKRFLNDTLSALYKIFRVETNCDVSTFCKYRPAYVVSRQLTGRDTCLCTKCKNFKFLVRALNASGVITECSAQDLLDSLCCSPPTLACRLRECRDCYSKTVQYSDHDEKGTVSYFKWETTSEERISSVTKKPILVKICQNQRITCAVVVAKGKLEATLWDRMGHGGRIVHQFQEWRFLEETMSKEDLLVECDWSENWSIKCASEVQSMHFGGSHRQISLHTGYAQSTENKETFCTLSEVTRHDPVAIYAHVKPVLARNVTMNTKYIHFRTDGPTSQYRCKAMFFIVAEHISKDFPQMEKKYWNFSEAGHGKHVSDGVGGTIKRVADSIVAHGRDILNVNVLIESLKEKNLKTFVCYVPRNDIDAAEKKIIVPDCKSFPGTMKVHQYIWSSVKPKSLVFKTLSCYSCRRKLCPHFPLGDFNFPGKKQSKPCQSRRARKK